MEKMKFISVDKFIRDIIAISPFGNEAYVPLLRQSYVSMEMLNLYVAPSIASKKFVVSINGTVKMPENCTHPLMVVKLVGPNDEYCLPLSQKGFYKAPQKKQSVFDCKEGDVLEFPDYNSNEFVIPYKNYYGEQYYSNDDQSFGHWMFDDQNSQVILQGVRSNTKVAITYQTFEAPQKKRLLDVRIQGVLRQHVLMEFFSITDFRQSEAHRSRLKIEVSNYKRLKKKVTPDDLLNAFRRGYKSTVKL